MKPGENGSPKPLPTLHVGWSEECQDVTLNFESQDFRRWEFVIAVLGMAKEKAENALKVWRMQQLAQEQQAAMQQAMVQQQLENALHQGQTKILKG